MKTVLFLCTGNYYRSRFAEFYFRHLAQARRLPWTADSRGLALDPFNPGPMSHYTVEACHQLGVSTEPLRLPLPLEETDLSRCQLTIAVKETEHRLLLRRKFPEWEHRVEYWEIHDIDVETPQVALPQLKLAVEQLVERLSREQREAG